MNHDRFLELLNLYLDHEISAADAAALEQEIQQNPERRRLYHQYCQLHVGTSQLFEVSRQSAPSPRLARSLQRIQERVDRPAQRPSWLWWSAGAAGGLAAASVALVLAFKPAQPQEPALAQTTPVTAPIATVAAVPAPAPTVEAPNAPVLWADSSLVARTDESSFVVQTVKLRPIHKVQTFDPTSFQQKYSLPTDRLEAQLDLRNPQATGTAEEMTAVQFKR